MTDNGMKGRVKALFAGPPVEPTEPHPTVPPPAAPPTGEGVPVPALMQMADPQSHHRALQVLVMAQRTADEYVTTAHEQAERIRVEARAAAEQTGRDAQAYAEARQHEADRALANAQAEAEQTAREAHAHADGVRREADQVLADAKAQAAELGDAAQASADALAAEAQQRYDDAVGGLAAQRAELQEQIEHLQQFDRDYRARLRSFMHDQLLALGVDEPPPPRTVTAAPVSAPPQSVAPPGR